MREIAGIRIPGSKLATAALDLVKAESHVSIYKHVLRTFVFGARRHIHGFECPDFIDFVSASKRSEWTLTQSDHGAELVQRSDCRGGP